MTRRRFIVTPDYVADDWEEAARVIGRLVAEEQRGTLVGR